MQLLKLTGTMIICRCCCFGGDSDRLLRSLLRLSVFLRLSQLCERRSRLWRRECFFVFLNFFILRTRSFSRFASRKYGTSLSELVEDDCDDEDDDEDELDVDLDELDE